MQASSPTVPGRVRGIWVRQWAAHCRRRWGEAAVAKVRARAGVHELVLPDVPDDKGWYPASAQLAVTQAMVDLYLGGDRARLQPLFEADALADLGRLQRLALRAWGPTRAYARLAALHPHLCDVGQLEVRLRDRGAEVDYRGAPLFAEPLWRDLQLWAHRAAVRVLAGAGEVTPLPAGEASFGLKLRW